MDKDTLLRSAIGPLGSVEPHKQMLKVPADDQLLYKMMTVENLIRSIAGGYLHFNRVDSYDDQNDGRQLPLDQPGNASVRFVRNPGFSASNYYDQSRARTYACCFSMENSNFIWSKYANGSERGKVCVIFDFGKLRAKLNQAMQPGNAALEYKGVRCHQVFSINYGIVEYVDRNSHQENAGHLPNPITYTYLKDTRYFDEKELRVSLSAIGIGQFALNEGTTMDFPTSLQMVFDFRVAISAGVIQEISLAPESDSAFLHTELAKLRIVPQADS